VSVQKNTWNSRVRKRNKIGVKGVCTHHTGKWRATIFLDKKQVHLGLFRSQEEAKAAYEAAAAKARGEFHRP
jgi:hypothetical protein